MTPACSPLPGVGHDVVMRLDHVSYAAGPEGLGACVQSLGARLGAGFIDGGIHPSFGTRNFVLPLADSCYLEVVAALDHPAVDRAPFGRAVRDRSADGRRLARVGHRRRRHRAGRGAARPPAAAGHRRRPDGVDLRWSQIGVNDVADDAQLPFFVQWHSDPADHPSAGGSRVRLTHLEIAGDEARIDEYLGTSNQQPFDGVEVAWLSSDEGTGVVAAVFDTANGSVRIELIRVPLRARRAPTRPGSTGSRRRSRA